MCDQPNVLDADYPVIDFTHRLANQGFIDKLEDQVVYESDLMQAHNKITQKFYSSFL